MEDTMRGLFFIMKGQYRDKCEPSYTNRVTGEVGYVGGFDPDREDTQEWYMLYDRKCYYCVACGSDFNKVLQGVKSQIIRHKGVAKNYFRHVCKVTSEDYYEVHYLGHQELTPEKRAKKAQGRCPRTSPIMKCLHEEVDRYYGDYYADEIRQMENEAYKELAGDTLLNRSRKMLKRPVKPAVQTPVVEEPQTEETPIEVGEKKPVLKKQTGKPSEDVTPKPASRIIKPRKLFKV